MRVLVTAASRHWSTREIAEAIARGLTSRGVAADARPVEEPWSLDDHDAFVIGSAVHVGHWLEPARELVETQAAALAAAPVWLSAAARWERPRRSSPTATRSTSRS
jgi:menaquinone-dependent protoporphyrinogen oxidase